MLNTYGVTNKTEESECKCANSIIIHTLHSALYAEVSKQRYFFLVKTERDIE